MKKLLLSLMMVAAFAVGHSANAATIERSDDGNLTINLFASIIESFRVTIENADIVLAGAAPAADGLLDLNGGMAGFDGLKSVAASACRDDLNAPPVYADVATVCTVVLGTPVANASNSKLVFDVDFDVKVELSGPGSVDLAVVMGGTAGDEPFAATTILFDDTSASLTGLVDQASHSLNFHGEAPFSGGPSYDDTIVVSVTKQ